MANIYIITFGCTLNFADSELMAGQLEKEGHKIVKSPDKAELIIVNGCTVKHLAEKKFFRAIEDALKNNKKVIAAGCVTQADQAITKSKLKDISIIGTKNLNQIAHVVEETLQGNVIHILKTQNKKNKRAGIPRIRRNQIIGIIPISEGCLGNCSYCKTRQARGTLVSYTPEEIMEQVKEDIKDNCKEICLTSQDCGAYGKDIGTDIISLLKQIAEIPGDFKIRLGMMNPNFALEFLDELKTVFQENKDRFYRFIHIPVQAGNNRILQLMRRKYTREDFIKICKTLRETMPDITIATDIICGFPTETDKEFEDTLDLVKTIKPDIVNRSRFWPRPGTDAAEMPQHHGRTTNKRSRELKEIFEPIALERNKTWENWQGKILIDEKGTVRQEESWIGRNYAYKPIVVKNSHKLGETLKVNTTKAHTHHIDGTDNGH